MTDKLADALKSAIKRFETIQETHKDIALGVDLAYYRRALSEHKAAKAATPDNVKEAVDTLMSFISGPDIMQFPEIVEAQKTILSARGTMRISSTMLDLILFVIVTVLLGVIICMNVSVGMSVLFVFAPILMGLLIDR